MLTNFLELWVQKDDDKLQRGINGADDYYRLTELDCYVFHDESFGFQTQLWFCDRTSFI